MSSLPDWTPNHVSGIYAAAFIAILILVLVLRPSQGPNLDAFPTVRSGTGWLGSWWDKYQYLTNAVDLLHQGYKEHRTAPFKIATLSRWTVILTNREHIDEFVRAPESDLSFVEGTDDRVNTRLTLGGEIHASQYHLGAVRTHLTRNIEHVYPLLCDEIVTAFADLLDLDDNEWKSVPALHLAQTVVCRTNNRLFVGLPLCRDPDWIDLCIRYTEHVGTAGVLLGLLPKWMRPLALPLFKGITRGRARALTHLGPIIDQRLRAHDQGAEQPNDLLTWMLDEAQTALTPASLVSRVLFINVAAIHATSTAFTHALFYLGAYPDYVHPLREEVERVVAQHGWSKAGVSEMVKVDSFLKECQRLEGIDAMAMVRKAVRAYTFKDGTHVPRGTLLGVASRPLHHAAASYDHPYAFWPFRFVERPFVTTAADYLVFGHGHHACPGRFFAANELKVMLAHVVTRYDVALESERPQSVRFGTSILADPRGRVLFRKRVA